MSPRSRARGGRGLLVTALLFLGLMAVLDLTRDRSLLLSVWHGVTGPEGAPIERILRGVGIIRR